MWLVRSFCVPFCLIRAGSLPLTQLWTLRATVLSESCVPITHVTNMFGKCSGLKDGAWAYGTSASTYPHRRNYAIYFRRVHPGYPIHMGVGGSKKVLVLTHTHTKPQFSRGAMQCQLPRGDGESVRALRCKICEFVSGRHARNAVN